MMILKWRHNSVVTLASNCHTVSPMKIVDIVGFVDGNKYMVGVDYFDDNKHSMRISIRDRKWWFPFFAFGIDASCQNSWKLMKENFPEEKLTYCQFRSIIAKVYLHKYGIPHQKKSGV